MCSRKFANRVSSALGHFSFQCSAQLEQLETRTLMAADTATNPVNPLDVNGNGTVTPLDSLYVINDLNAAGAHPASAQAGPPYYDVNADGRVSPLDSLRINNFLNGSEQDFPPGTLMSVTLVATDASGNVLTSVAAGSTFYLNEYVQDVGGRGANSGVFAVYTDVTYSTALASISPTATIAFGPEYPNVHRGDLSVPGQVTQIGGVAGLTPVGSDRLLMWTLPVQAAAPGSLVFGINQNLTPGYEGLEYGFDFAIPPSQIQTTGTTLQVTGGSQPSTLLLLDPSGRDALNASGNALVSVTGTGSAIIVNSNNREAALAAGSALVTATSIDVSGAAKTRAGGQYSGAIVTQAPTADPLALALPPAPAAVHSAVRIAGSQVLTLEPGTYVGGIAIGGQARVTLSPGVYYLQGGGLAVGNQATLKGNGVLIVNAPQTGADTIRIGAQARVSLIAAATLPAPYTAYQGIALMQDPASSLLLTVAGQARLDVSGTLYAPHALLLVRDGAVVNDPGISSASIGGQLILADLTVSGNARVSLQATTGSTAVATAAVSNAAATSTALAIAPAGHASVLAAAPPPADANSPATNPARILPQALATLSRFVVPRKAAAVDLVLARRK